MKNINYSPRFAGSKRRDVVAMLAIAAWSMITPALAQDDLLEVLRDKAILTEQEYSSLKASGATAGDALLGVLKAKGVLTDDEYRKLAATKPAAKDKKDVVARFKDGVVFENGEKDFSLSLNGRIHADYRHFDGANFDSRDVDTFEARRARLGVNATFYRDYEVEITGDFAASAKLDTAYLNLAWWKPAQIKIGLFKMPFSLEELTSSNYIDFQERSFANALVPSKERGVMLHGAPWTGLYYGLAFSNGNGGADTDDNDGKDAIGRMAVNLAEIAGYRKAVIHAGAAFSNGTQPVGDIVPNGRTEGRGVRFFDPAAFTGAPIDRERTGLEGALAFGPVKLQAESIGSEFSGRNAAGLVYDREVEARYASLSWLVTGESYADAYKKGAFGRITPKANFNPHGRGGPGAVELGLRYSKLDASDFRSTNPAGTGVLPANLANEADAWTLGLKWIVNPNTRFLVNYIRTRFDTPVTLNGETRDEEKALTLRAQLNF